MSIFISKKIWKFLIKIQLPKIRKNPASCQLGLGHLLAVHSFTWELKFVSLLMWSFELYQNKSKQFQNKIQAFLDFRGFPGFDLPNFRFTAVYNSILFSSPLVLLSIVTAIYAVFASAVFILCPHINSVNRGMPVFFL